MIRTVTVSPTAVVIVRPQPVRVPPSFCVAPAPIGVGAGVPPIRGTSSRSASRTPRCLPRRRVSGTPSRARPPWGLAPGATPHTAGPGRRVRGGRRTISTSDPGRPRSEPRLARPPRAGGGLVRPSARGGRLRYRPRPPPQPRTPAPARLRRVPQDTVKILGHPHGGESPTGRHRNPHRRAHGVPARASHQCAEQLRAGARLSCAGTPGQLLRSRSRAAGPRPAGRPTSVAQPVGSDDSDRRSPADGSQFTSGRTAPGWRRAFTRRGPADGAGP